MNKATELISKLADDAEKAGIAVDGEPGGAVHCFVMSQGCPIDKAFFVVFLVTADLADREARREGYTDQFDRACQHMKARREDR